MELTRDILADDQWKRLRRVLPPQKQRIGRPAKNHRPIVNGILWILRTGAPWRDLPTEYGPWQTIATRFYRWVKKLGYGAGCFRNCNDRRMPLES